MVEKAATIKSCNPGDALVKCNGQDISRKKSKSKNRIMMVLPAQLAFKRGTEGQLGVLEKADTDKPEFVVETPEGTFRFPGQFVSTSTTFFTIACLPKRNQSACEDVFDTALVFSKPTFTEKVKQNGETDEKSSVVKAPLLQSDMKRRQSRASISRIEHSEADMNESFFSQEGSVELSQVSKQSSSATHSQSAMRLEAGWDVHHGCSSLCDNPGIKGSKVSDIVPRSSSNSKENSTFSSGKKVKKTRVIKSTRRVFNGSESESGEEDDNEEEEGEEALAYLAVDSDEDKGNRRSSSRAKTVKTTYTDLESEEDTRSVSSDDEADPKVEERGGAEENRDYHDDKYVDKYEGKVEDMVRGEDEEWEEQSTKGMKVASNIGKTVLKKKEKKVENKVEKKLEKKVEKKVERVLERLGAQSEHPGGPKTISGITSSSSSSSSDSTRGVLSSAETPGPLGDDNVALDLEILSLPRQSKSPVRKMPINNGKHLGSKKEEKKEEEKKVEKVTKKKEENEGKEDKEGKKCEMTKEEEEKEGESDDDVNLYALSARTKGRGSKRSTLSSSSPSFSSSFRRNSTRNKTVKKNDQIKNEEMEDKEEERTKKEEGEEEEEEEWINDSDIEVCNPKKRRSISVGQESLFRKYSISKSVGGATTDADAVERGSENSNNQVIEGEVKEWVELQDEKLSKSVKSDEKKTQKNRVQSVVPPAAKNVSKKSSSAFEESEEEDGDDALDCFYEKKNGKNNKRKSSGSRISTGSAGSTAKGKGGKNKNENEKKGGKKGWQEGSENEWGEDEGEEDGSSEVEIYSPKKKPNNKKEETVNTRKANRIGNKKTVKDDDVEDISKYGNNNSQQMTNSPSAKLVKNVPKNSQSSRGSSHSIIEIDLSGSPPRSPELRSSGRIIINNRNSKNSGNSDFSGGSSEKKRNVNYSRDKSDSAVYCRSSRNSLTVNYADKSPQSSNESDF